MVKLLEVFLEPACTSWLNNPLDILCEPVLAPLNSMDTIINAPLLEEFSIIAAGDVFAPLPVTQSFERYTQPLGAVCEGQFKLETPFPQSHAQSLRW